MIDESAKPGPAFCIAVAAAWLAGFIALAARLASIQLFDASGHGYELDRQSVRRVQTGGIRGRILDRNGLVLAGNRESLSIAVDASFFERKTWNATALAVKEAVDGAAALLGLEPAIGTNAIHRHLVRELSRPLVVWRDIDKDVLAKFSEIEFSLPGFKCIAGEERVYPHGALAAHLLGYVGRDRAESVEGDEKFNYREMEMRGRSGIEFYYDSFLRGSPGEDGLLVDARGFSRREWIIVPPKKGPDLVLTIDSSIQAAAESALKGFCGACVVLDAKDGAVLAMASAPGFNPNDFVPVLKKEVYDPLAADKAKPLLNRAAGGTYAPGSTFKPVTALAAIGSGLDPAALYECTGAFVLGRGSGEMRIRCARTWGHGGIDCKGALRDSCNAYFCNAGMEAGTNALAAAARALGLGAKTGIDFGVDSAGMVPDEERKLAAYGQKWYPGDLAQMSIGQGMLLATPLQMARVAAAIGTGSLTVPRLKADVPAKKEPLPFDGSALETVREGMRLVTLRGTGKKGADGVDANVIGKTGTAEVGRGKSRRKNTWFIAYAEPGDGRPLPAVSLAIVLENGESGGGTAAPRARSVLAKIYGAKKEAGNVR